MTIRRNRADAIDTCPVSWHVTLRHASSPFRPPTIRRSDNSRGRISAMKSRVAEVACLRGGPRSARYCRGPPSKVSNRRRKYLCMRRRPCGPGIVWAALDYVGPTRRCVRRCSSWSTPWNLARSPRRNTPVLRMSVQPWSSASGWPGPKCSADSPHRRLLTSFRPEATSPTCIRGTRGATRRSLLSAMSVRDARFASSENKMLIHLYELSTTHTDLM